VASKAKEKGRREGGERKERGFVKALNREREGG